ncbi:dienelactone hydrolase family protein [Akkermansiaceae bacterium]|nr:dienelactone hydrolase family protein [Akkermansiaceae bacterium]
MKTLFGLLAALAGVFGAHGGIVEKSVPYEQGGVELEGFHAYDDGFDGKRPGILIIHQWTGLTDYEKMRARMLAELGYNVFAADIYGAGIRPQPPEAGEEAGKYKSDRELFRARILAGLEVLEKDERTDTTRIAAIGYCFGGTGVLELARAGTKISGVISFHGGLAAAEGMGAKAGKIPARVLCLHGAIDPYVPPAEVEAFRIEMSDAGADWQLTMYGGAVHAFTQKMAGDDASKGAAYDARADARSWEDMQKFFAEIFVES